MPDTTESINEVLVQACGYDEDLVPNAFMKLETRLLPISMITAGEADEPQDDRDEAGELLSEQILDGPAIQISRGFVFTTVDLMFEEEDEEAFLETERILREYSLRESAFHKNPVEKPAMILTIVPRELAGEFYICGIYGAWGLMSRTSGEIPDTVRLIFHNELFHVFHINEDRIAEIMKEEEDES